MVCQNCHSEDFKRPHYVQQQTIYDHTQGITKLHSDISVNLLPKTTQFYLQCSSLRHLKTSENKQKNNFHVTFQIISCVWKNVSLEFLYLCAIRQQWKYKYYGWHEKPCMTYIQRGKQHRGGCISDLSIKSISSQLHSCNPHHHNSDAIFCWYKSSCHNHNHWHHLTPTTIVVVGLSQHYSA